MNNRHRVLICDDQYMVRFTTREILKHYAPDIEVVAEASGGEAGIAAALKLQPDLVLMDVMMPDLDGFEATRQIVQASTVKVLAHSSLTSWETVDQMFEAGARGYVLKQGDPRELVRAIRTVIEDGFFISPGNSNGGRKCVRLEKKSAFVRFQWPAERDQFPSLLFVLMGF